MSKVNNNRPQLTDTSVNMRKMLQESDSIHSILIDLNNYYSGLKLSMRRNIPLDELRQVTSERICKELEEVEKEIKGRYKGRLLCPVEQMYKEIGECRSKYNEIIQQVKGVESTLSTLERMGCKLFVNDNGQIECSNINGVATKEATSKTTEEDRKMFALLVDFAESVKAIKEQSKELGFNPRLEKIMSSLERNGYQMTGDVYFGLKYAMNLYGF